MIQTGEIQDNPLDWRPYHAPYPVDYNDLSTVTVQNLINSIRSDAVFADRYWLPNSDPLFPFQNLTLKTFDEHKFTWEQAIRGAAKSYGAARYCLVKGLTHKAKFVFTGPTYRQALHPFNYIVTLIEENSQPGNPLDLSKEVESIVRGSMFSRIKLKNGTEFVALPMGDGEKIRGERADVLVCDEFFLMDRAMYQSHILSFLKGYKKQGSVGPKLIITTSAEYQDSFAYTVFTDRFIKNLLIEDKLVAQDPTYKRKYAILDINVDDLIKQGYITDMDIHEQQLVGATPEERQQALYNHWIGVSGQFFPANLVTKLRSDLVTIEHESDGNHRYCMTIDVATAQNGDLFILDIWKMLPELGNKMGLVNSYWNKGLGADEMASKIHSFNRRFHPTWIVMDKGGGGLFVRDALMKNKLVFRDGSTEDIKVPILEHNENRIVGDGERKLILNRPSDPKIREAFVDNSRSTGVDYIHSEDVFVHLMYDGLRQLLQREDQAILIPSGYVTNDDADPEVSNAVIFDNITESVLQLRHLALKINVGADGHKEVARTKVNKMPYYVWKNAVKDGASGFIYGYLAYQIFNRNNAPPVAASPIVRTIRTDEGIDFTGMVDHTPGQVYVWNK